MQGQENSVNTLIRNENPLISEFFAPVKVKPSKKRKAEEISVRKEDDSKSDKENQNSENFELKRR